VAIEEVVKVSVEANPDHRFLCGWDENVLELI